MAIDSEPHIDMDLDIHRGLGTTLRWENGHSLDIDDNFDSGVENTCISIRVRTWTCALMRIDVGECIDMGKGQDLYMYVDMDKDYGNPSMWVRANI